MRRIADIMREAGTKIDTVRLQGHSYVGRYSEPVPTYDGQAGFMVANLRRVFEGVEVQKWEFEVLSGASLKREVVFDVDSEGKLSVAVDERRTASLKVEKVHTELCKSRSDKREREERMHQETRKRRLG